MAEQPTKERVWKFDRYRDGRLMAEGAEVRRATSLEDALAKAQAMFADTGNREEFKLRGSNG